MAETTAQEIARIRAILSSGAQTITVDGVSAAVDATALRRRLRELLAEDETTGVKRPVIQKVYLGGW